MKVFYRYIWVLCVCFFLSAQVCRAGNVSVKESQLVGNILMCMQYKDTISYAAMFPTFDSLWYHVMTYTGSSDDEAAIAHIRQHPEKVQQFDPAYNPSIIANYCNLLKKGEDSGIHWDRIVLDRFELQRMPLTRDMLGYEKVAVNRFQGYVFVKDMLTRRIYAFTITEMQQIHGLWYGGQVLNILEASTAEEFNTRQAAEVRRQRMLAALGLTEADLALIDSAHHNGIKDGDPEKDKEDEMAENRPAGGLERMEVGDRKLFGGTFDNEIKVKLYIRYLKGSCPEGICAWEAIYKFGDQEDYIKLDVTKTKEGKWLFTEDPPVGAMELTFKDNVFTGTWGSADDKTGYDVRLTQMELSPQRALELDGIFNHRAFAKSPKEKDEEKEKVKKAKEDNNNDDMY